MDVTITLTIPSAKVAKASEGYLKLFPNTETIPDPNNEGETLPKYTDKQWIEYKIRETVIRDIHRGLGMIAQENATVEVDTAIVE